MPKVFRILTVRDLARALSRIFSSNNFYDKKRKNKTLNYTITVADLGGSTVIKKGRKDNIY